MRIRYNRIELLDVVRVSFSLALVFPLAAATLQQWCAARALELEEIASLFRQFVRGLSHVHANAIFHAGFEAVQHLSYNAWLGRESENDVRCIARWRVD